jgi:nucleoside-diphosphate-sugar epimerase
MDNSTFTFLVTGATGYIASWIVVDLLNAGHTVYGSVRDLDNKDKYAHLTSAAEKADGHLELFEADLLIDGSFNEAAKACDFVLHTASPFKIDVSDPKRDLIDPAVKGTENVMRAALASERVKRIVVTSSAAAIYGDNRDIQDKDNGRFEPGDWNTTSTENHQAYSFSKTEAEKTARRMIAEQSEKELVTIHPGFVLGPTLAPRKDSTSIDFILQMLGGQFKPGAPQLYFGFVDVRDVSEMHIRAALSDGGNGKRYIGISESGHILMLADKIESQFPGEFPLPKRFIPKFLMYIMGPFLGLSWKFVSRNIGIPIAFDNSLTVRDLDIKFRSITESLHDMVKQIKKRNWID